MRVNAESLRSFADRAAAIIGAPASRRRPRRRASRRIWGDGDRVVTDSVIQLVTLSQLVGDTEKKTPVHRTRVLLGGDWCAFRLRSRFIVTRGGVVVVRCPNPGGENQAATSRRSAMTLP